MHMVMMRFYNQLILLTVAGNKFRREDRDSGTIYGGAWYQTGPPRERRMQSTRVSSLESPMCRESGGNRAEARKEKHDDVSWEPGEGQVEVESSLEGEVSSQQGGKGTWQPGPQSSHTTGKKHQGRKGSNVGAATPSGH